MVMPYPNPPGPGARTSAGLTTSRIPSIGTVSVYSYGSSPSWKSPGGVGGYHVEVKLVVMLLCDVLIPTLRGRGEDKASNQVSTTPIPLYSTSSSLTSSNKVPLSQGGGVVST